MPASLSHTWAHQPPSPLLRLPPVNPYVPTDFSLRAGEAEAEAERTEIAALTARLGLPVVLAAPPIMLQDGPGERGVQGKWGGRREGRRGGGAGVCLREAEPNRPSLDPSLHRPAAVAQDGQQLQDPASSGPLPTLVPGPA